MGLTSQKTNEVGSPVRSRGLQCLLQRCCGRSRYQGQRLVKSSSFSAWLCCQRRQSHNPMVFSNDSTDEAHHVTRTMLGATGKVHNHEEVQGLRRDFTTITESHILAHGPLPKNHERHEAATAHILRENRETVVKGTRRTGW